MARSALKFVQDRFPQVRTAVDADKPIQIEVLPEDVKQSTRKNHRACAMAVACKRSMHLDGIIVSVKVAWLIKGKKATRYTIPPSVSREITSFDRGAGFMPGTYQLSRPSSTHRLGNGHVGGPDPRNREKARKRPAVRHYTTGIRAILGQATV